jgi:hypothetical protein
MLRELDFVEGDWQALLWTLGSATALVRHSAPRELRSAVGKRVGPAGRLVLSWIAENAAAPVALWRRRRNVAVGLLLSAMTFTTHLVVHVANHN